MCLIYARTEDHKAPIDWEHLKRAHQANPDGFGYMVWDFDKEIWHTAKETRISWKAARTIIEQLDQDSGRFAIHFRYATVGKVSKLNCHPFNLRNGEHLMHNGTMNIEAPDGYSDSRYVASILRESGQTAHALLNLACTGNKNRFLIANEDGALTYYGEWHEQADGDYSKGKWKTEERQRSFIESYATRRGRHWLGN